METQVVEYNVTDAAIQEMSSMYMGLEITDLDDKEQYDVVHKAHMVVRGKRIEVDKKRKELKADALAWGKKVQTEANRIFDLIEPIESHLKAEKNKVALEKERIENERIAGIQEKVDLLRCINIPDTQEGLKTLIDRLETNLEITPDEYFEFMAEAFQIKQDKLLAARNALETRERLDREEAERKAESERLAAERKKQAEEAFKLRAQQETLAAAQKKIDDEKAALEAEKRAEQERKDREEFERQAKIEAEEKAAWEAKEKAARELREKEESAAEAERQKALLPDKEKLEAFSQFLTQGISYPEVESGKAVEAVRVCRETIESLGEVVFDAAQKL